MKRLFRVFIALLLLLSTAGLALWCYYQTPVWLEAKINQTLSQWGITKASFRIDAIRHNRITASKIDLGPDFNLKIDTFTANYAMDQLFEGQIENIQISGLKWRPEIKDGSIDLKPWKSLKFPHGNGGKDLPIRGVSIFDNCRFFFKWNDFDLVVSFYSMIKSYNGQLLLSLIFDPLITPWANIHPRLDAAVQITPDAYVLNLWIEATAAVNPPISSSQGPVQIELYRNEQPIVVTIPKDRPDDWRCKIPNIRAQVKFANLAATLLGSGTIDSSGFASEIQLAQPLKLDQYGVEAIVQKLIGKISGSFGGGQFQWRHHWAYQADSLKLPGAQLSIASVSGEYPGNFTIDGLQQANRSWPPILGKIEPRDNQIRLEADWKPHDALPVKLSATIDASGAKFSAKLPPTELVDNRVIASLIPALTDLNIDGGIAATIDGEYRHDQLSARARIDFEDATLQIHRWDVTAYGVGGSIVFDDLLKARTGPTQILTADRIKIGSIKLTDAQAEFQINSPTQMLLEQISCTIGDYGSLAAHAISIDTANFNIDTELYIENLNLGDWMSVLTQEKLSATGEIFGRVPVKYRPVEKKLELGNGYLYSGPEGGSLHVNEPRKIVDLLSQYDPRFAEGGQLQPVRDQAQEALNAFDYSLFRFDLVPEAGGGHMLRIETRGKGRAKTGGDKPLEIGSLVVNIHNFQQAVNAFMIGKLQLTPDQSVDRMLERFFQKTGDQENKP